MTDIMAYDVPPPTEYQKERAAARQRVRMVKAEMDRIAAALPPDFDWESGTIAMPEWLVRACEELTGIPRGNKEDA